MDTLDSLIPSIGDGLVSVGLVVAFFFMLARGIIVTRREAEAYREDRDMWRTAYENRDKADAITREQFNELLEGSRTSRAFIESFMKAVES